MDAHLPSSKLEIVYFCETKVFHFPNESLKRFAYFFAGYAELSRY